MDTTTLQKATTTTAIAAVSLSTPSNTITPQRSISFSSEPIKIPLNAGFATQLSSGSADSGCVSSQKTSLQSLQALPPCSVPISLHGLRTKDHLQRLKQQPPYKLLSQDSGIDGLGRLGRSAHQESENDSLSHKQLKCKRSSSTQSSSSESLGVTISNSNSSSSGVSAAKLSGSDDGSGSGSGSGGGSGSGSGSTDSYESRHCFRYQPLSSAATQRAVNKCIEEVEISDEDNGDDENAADDDGMVLPADEGEQEEGEDVSEDHGEDESDNCGDGEGIDEGKRSSLNVDTGDYILNAGNAITIDETNKAEMLNALNHHSLRNKFIAATAQKFIITTNTLITLNEDPKSNIVLREKAQESQQVLVYDGHEYFYTNKIDYDAKLDPNLINKKDGLRDTMYFLNEFDTPQLRPKYARKQRQKELKKQWKAKAKTKGGEEGVKMGKKATTTTTVLAHTEGQRVGVTTEVTSATTVVAATAKCEANNCDKSRFSNDKSKKGEIAVDTSTVVEENKTKQQEQQLVSSSQKLSSSATPSCVSWTKVVQKFRHIIGKFMICSYYPQMVKFSRGR